MPEPHAQQHKKRVAIAAETASSAEVEIPHYPKNEAVIEFFGESQTTRRCL